MTALTPNEIVSALDTLPGWHLEDGKVLRDFTFEDFAQALLFTNRVGALAERENHHPDIDIRYNRVRLAWWTHDAGGITRRDLRLAGLVDVLAGTA